MICTSNSQSNWQLAGGSIPGSDHTMPGKPLWKNNQDAFLIHQDAHATIAIVSDGCGSGSSSEVGAQIGVRLLAEILKDLAQRGISPNWECIRMELLSQISVMARAMGVSFSGVVGEYFLFSLLGVYITQDRAWLFSCGDGMYAIDGMIRKLGPFPDNAPPYLSYGLLGESAPPFLITEHDPSTIQTIALGTDGTDYIADLDKTLAEWAETDALFRNPDGLRRQLAIMNLEKIDKGILRPGPLKDDTTVILLRHQQP